MQFQNNIKYISKVTFEIGGFIQNFTKYVIEIIEDHAMIRTLNLIL